MRYDLAVLYEHPEWQKPLFAALDQRGVRYTALDLKRAAFDPDAVPEGRRVHVPRELDADAGA